MNTANRQYMYVCTTAHDHSAQKNFKDVYTYLPHKDTTTRHSYNKQMHKAHPLTQSYTHRLAK